MKFKKLLGVDAIVFMFFGAVVGLLAIQMQNQQGSPSTIETHASVPTPTVAFIPTNNTISQISSDGTKKIILKTTQNSDASQSYELSTNDNGPVIFSKTLPAGESMSIPFNTWSPDNTYFFIKEQTADSSVFIVFRANGEAFADGEAYHSLTDAFAQRATGNIFDDATGWADDGLIIINTKTQDNLQGPSYWFSVANKAIIPLSTKF